MIDTKMPAIAFARKLRARRDALKVTRTAEIAKHKQAVKKWRVKLAAWLAANAHNIADAADATSSRWNRGVDSLAVHNMPQPPKEPGEGRLIKKIDSVLRRLALTGQKHVTLNPAEVDELFGAGVDDG